MFKLRLEHQITNPKHFKMTVTKAKWAIDPSHSEVQFKVKHLVISTVTGSFKKFEGTLETEGEDFDGAKAAFSVDVKSIDTGAADRDGHLRTNDFFAADEYPTINFEGTLKKVGDNTYKMTGPFTLRGVTKDIELDVTYGGTMVDPYGQTKAGFEISGSINRKEYGVSWSAVTEAGGVVVGDEVKLGLNVQVVKQ